MTKAVEVPTPAAGTCCAIVGDPPYYFDHHFCGKKAKVEVRPGVHVCGTHARVVEKWGDSADTMIEHWWTSDDARRSTERRLWGGGA